VKESEGKGATKPEGGDTKKKEGAKRPRVAKPKK